MQSERQNDTKQTTTHTHTQVRRRKKGHEKTCKGILEIGLRQTSVVYVLVETESGFSVRVLSSVGSVVACEGVGSVGTEGETGGVEGGGRGGG